MVEESCHLLLHVKGVRENTEGKLVLSGIKI